MTHSCSTLSSPRPEWATFALLATNQAKGSGHPASSHPAGQSRRQGGLPGTADRLWGPQRVLVACSGAFTACPHPHKDPTHGDSLQPQKLRHGEEKRPQTYTCYRLVLTNLPAPTTALASSSPPTGLLVPQASQTALSSLSSQGLSVSTVHLSCPALEAQTLTPEMVRSEVLNLNHRALPPPSSWGPR
jgi:hypothetical protein